MDIMMKLPKKSDQSLNLDYVRCTLRIPMDLSIKVDMTTSKTNTPRNWWIIQAIQEKLDRASEEGSASEEELRRMENTLKGLKDEIKELKKGLLKTEIK